MPAPALTSTIESVLAFWFGAHAGDADTAQAQRKLWWSKNTIVDADIRQRFGTLVQNAATGAHDDWAHDPRGRLTLILLFDQFPRNIYRDTPQAFAYDARALQLALDGIAAGVDRALRPIERVFCYLPLEHAESAGIQERSVAMFTALAAGTAEADRSTFAGYVDSAVRHRDVIQRFGRFPHRNRILGRASTAEEEQFLREPGSSF
ncbi:MAG: DUF924 family protein [Burkholderiales bacterium]|nr:DUF924 family protein [Burkholderiales bacterium]